MKELLDKISSYNVFNYLLPGIVFAFLASNIIHYSLGQRDIFSSAFLYYFMGMVVSRFGSLIIEPFLRYISFVRFASYKEFIDAEKKDPKIEGLSEVNNTYRTFCSLFSLLALMKLYTKLEDRFACIRNWDSAILVALLLVMFAFSYRKQTSYITSRIRRTRES